MTSGSFLLVTVMGNLKPEGTFLTASLKPLIFLALQMALLPMNVLLLSCIGDLENMRPLSYANPSTDGTLCHTIRKDKRNLY